MAESETYPESGYVGSPFEKSSNDPVRNARAYLGQPFQNETIRSVFKNVFGYIGTPHVNAKPENYLPFKRRNLYGVPIIMPLKLGGYEFLLEPLVEVHQSKKIIKTEIDGRKGTFKESFRLNDDKVTIKGVLLNQDDEDEYPADQARALRSLHETMQSVTVDEHTMLAEVFGITHLAIIDVKYKAAAGYPNLQPFVIEALSDLLHEEDFEIEIEPTDG